MGKYKEIRKGGTVLVPTITGSKEQQKDGIHDIVIPAGPLGFTFEGNVVTHVFEDSNVSKTLKVGWKIVGVNGVSMSNNNFAICRAIQKSNTNNMPTKITFSE